MTIIQNQMKILILDTATEMCSCALLDNAHVFSQMRLAARQHTELILPMIDALLAEAELSPTQLDGIAFGCGPGSFTGLRIASGVAQGIAFGIDIPVAPISDLATLAQQAYQQYGATHVLASLDARMSEVYWGGYQVDAQGCMQLIGQECVTPPSTVPLPALGQWSGIGSGWDVYANTLTAHVTAQGATLTQWWPNMLPQAADMVPLVKAAFQAGRVVSAEQAMPVYLRNQVANKLKKGRADNVE